MTISRLTAAHDLTAAIDLLCRFFSEEGFTTEASTIAGHARQLAGLETCGLFLAEEGGKAVGVATVSLEFGIEYGWWAEMGDLYVLPEYRGRGLSRALIAAIEDFLKERGVAGYQVTVTPHASEHHDLAQYYSRLGFNSEGRLILFKELV
ncbi:MAG: GNAT family N-acetyltransferase [Rhizobiales bacterium]|nr:GNAT family N-acetyltransferase [Hyphomicrobiales bacterium]